MTVSASGFEPSSRHGVFTTSLVLHQKQTIPPLPVHLVASWENKQYLCVSPGSDSANYYRYRKNLAVVAIAVDGGEEDVTGHISQVEPAPYGVDKGH